MKHALQDIAEVIQELDKKPTIVTSSIDSADVFYIFYKIGDEQWVTISVDYDLDDKYEIDSSEAKLNHEKLVLDGDGIKDLYEALKNIYEK